MLDLLQKVASLEQYKGENNEVLCAILLLCMAWMSHAGAYTGKAKILWIPE